MKIFFHRHQVSCILFIMLLIGVPQVGLGKTPSTGETSIDGTSRQLIHEAAQAVDDAWEQFHQAAIGGTLASPAIQAQIERQLHEARALLMESRKAGRRGDHRSVKIITEKLFHLSNEIVQASREKKR